MRPRLFFVLLGSLSVIACGGGQVSHSNAQPTGSAVGATQFAPVAIATFAAPWAMAVLPDQSFLVTEKAGRMLHVSADGRSRTSLAGLPPVKSEGQAALGEVTLHPEFARNRLVYFSYVAPGRNSAIVLARGRLEADRLADVETLFRASPSVAGNGHFAGRIAFSPDGFLFFSTGERQKFDPAQDAKATLGKIVRLDMDGKPAAGNPLAARGFDPAIWTYGHRNPLGLAFDEAGRLWEIEMGPQGGDEFNLVLPGRNYGWPMVSDGDHYDGRKIPDHATRPDLEAPKLSWNPVISPSSLLVYRGDRFPAWKGKALVGGLSSEALVVVDIAGDRAREVERHPMGARIRAVAQGADGALFLLEDGEGGRLLRLDQAR